MSSQVTKRLYALSAFALTAVPCSAAGHQDQSNSIVRVQGSAMPGSGVVIRQNGNKAIVWTVAHVIGNPHGPINITETNGGKTPAKIVSYSKEKDIAILEFQPSQQYRNIKTVSARPEEDITVIGFPSRLNLNSNKPEVFKSPSGFIFGQWNNSRSNYNVAYEGTTLPGMSGGGVFNQRGELVAIHALKDIRQAEITPCYGGKLKDNGQIGLQCLSSTPKGVQDQAATNKQYLTKRLLGSRGISVGRFDKSINETSNQQTFDIPNLLDSYQTGQSTSYPLTTKSLPNIVSGEIKNLSRDQKLSALVFYNNFPQTTSTPSSPRYQEAVLAALPKSNRSKIDHLLVFAATTFDSSGRGLEDAQDGSIDISKEIYRNAEKQWWNKYRQTRIDACVANGGSTSSCDPLLYTSENIYKRDLFTAASLQRLESKIKAGAADSDMYLEAASNLTYSNKDIAKALEFALKAEELGDQTATTLVEDLAKRTGDFEALLISKYNRITAQLELISTKPSLKVQAINNIWGLLPLKELEASPSGCEIGNEINSLLTQANIKTQINPYSYGQFTDAVKTACSNKPQTKDSTPIASAPKALKTLSDIGLKLPINAKELMTMPTDIPGIVGQYAQHPKKKSVEAIYKEIIASAKSNGLRLIKSLTWSDLPYSGGGSRCINASGMLCTATFTSNRYGHDHWFVLMVTDSPDSIIIQTSVIEAMTKRDPLFKLIYE